MSTCTIVGIIMIPMMSVIYFAVKHHKNSKKNLPKDMNTKRLLWARSCCLANMNMSIDKAAWSNSKPSSWNTLPYIILAGQLDRVQKHLFEHLPKRFITYVIFLFWFKQFTYLCNFLNFLTMSLSMKAYQKMKLKHSLVLIELYNPKIFRAVQII
jgi:hypothetical protein